MVLNFLSFIVITWNLEFFQKSLVIIPVCFATTPVVLKLLTVKKPQQEQFFKEDLGFLFLTQFKHPTDHTMIMKDLKIFLLEKSYGFRWVER